MSTLRVAVGRTAVVGASLLLAASGLAAPPGMAADKPTLTLITHDSFVLPDELIADFERRQGADLEVLAAGDAGSLVNKVILSRIAGDRPLADVLYGIDNTFLSRALAAGVFEPYRSPALENVPPEFLLDPESRVTPVDHADVCLNADPAGLERAGLPVPERLEDLADPAMAGTLVVENPATSSPGLAFLLATVAYFGEDPETGWHAFWQALRDNDVAVADGWEEAYYGDFSGGSGEGDRPIVVSYASSPVAEVVYGPDPEADEAPTRALDSGCFRQVEFAGVLAGSQEPDLAGAFIDYLLSPDVQAALPLAMYVRPVREDVAVPEVFERHALLPSEPLTMDPADIDAGRDRWIREWTDIVLR